MEPPNKRPKRGNNALSPDRIFNANSPVTTENAEIQAFLSLCMHNWTDYTEEEKSSIISKLPEKHQLFNHDNEGKLKCPMGPHFLLDDSVIKDQIARFKRDVTDGLYTKTWQEKARKAMEERASGKFDQHLADHVEEMFPTDDERGEEAIAGMSSDGEYGPSERRRKGKGRAGKDTDESHESQSQQPVDPVEQSRGSQEHTHDVSIHNEEEMAQ